MTIVKVEQTEDGEFYIPIPQEMLEALGWNQYTVVSCFLNGSELVMRQKTDWTVDQLQNSDNFDRVMDDVVHNKTVHNILQDGKRFIIAPYSDELKSLGVL